MTPSSSAERPDGPTPLDPTRPAPEPGAVAPGAPDHEAPAASYREIMAGINLVNFRLGQTIGRLIESSSQLYALTELLRRKGLIEPEELDELRGQVAPMLHDDAHASGLTLELGAEPDKYALTDLPVIDCAAILPVCRAACCRLPFPLSEQDIQEGVVQWDLAHPYLIRQQSESGFCVHLDPVDRQCSIYGERPAPCRQYDCRADERIWVDFERRELNPALAAALDRAAQDHER